MSLLSEKLTEISIANFQFCGLELRGLILAVQLKHFNNDNQKIEFRNRAITKIKSPEIVDIAGRV